MGHFGNGNRSAIVVGVNGSQKCDPPAPLKHAEKDAYELAAVLQTEYCSFSRVITLVGDGATSSSVLDAILGEIELVGEQDTLVFFYSGHGIPIAKSQGDYEIFLVTSDFNRQFAKHMPDRYISLRKLRDLIYHCGARQVIIVLDCCFSGEFGRDSERYQGIVAAIAEYFDVQPRDRSPNGGLRQALTASSHDAKASEANGQSMTRRLLPFLRGEQGARGVVDDDGYVTLTSIYEFLVGDMASGPPNLPGDPAGQRALLAFHPHLAPTSIKAREVADRDRIADEMQRIHSRLDEITDAQPFVDRQVASFDQELIRKVGVELLETPALNLFCSAERIYKQSEYQLGATPRDLLKLFGLIKDGQHATITIAALLCFANNPRSYPFLEGAFTRCVVFPGKDTRSTPIDDVELSQPLLMQFQEAISFMRRNLRLQRTSTDAQSPDRWEIPFEALREALANAYIHREYEGSTDGIEIRIFQDRIVISSPGQLPQGMDLAELEEPGQGKLRNAKIARVFYICGFVERLGTGIERLQSALQEAGLEPATFSQPARKGLKRFEVVFKRPAVALEGATALQAESATTPQALLEQMPIAAGDTIPAADSFASGNLNAPHKISLLPNELFSGRDTELRFLASALKSANGAVAITGLGGVGKTQLAIEFAHRYGRYFAGGVFWIDCADSERVPFEIAASGGPGALDLPGFGELPADEQVRLVKLAWRQPIPRLLIFDNCEDEGLLRAHRPPPGGCRMLVTSRRQQWASGQNLQLLNLDVLERDYSIALLQRLCSRLSTDEAGQIAAMLDDLPLALHLAGSFLDISSLSVTAFLTDLGKRRLEHPALRGQSSSYVPTYSQTGREIGLYAVLTLGLDRLDPGITQGALGRTLIAWAACLEPAGETFPADLLTRLAPVDSAAPDADLLVEETLRLLVNLGFLNREANGRLHMHPLVAAAVQQARLIEDPLAEFAPLALGYCTELITTADDWITSGRLNQGRNLLDREQVLWKQFLDWSYANEEGTSGLSLGARATAQLSNYWTLVGKKSAPATEQRLWRALAAAQRAADRLAEANVLRAIGDVQQFRDDRDGALSSYQQALALFREIGDRLGEANVFQAIGNVQQFRDDRDGALSSYQQALALFREIGAKLGEANVLKAIGDVQQFRKETSGALSSYQWALALFREVGDHLGEANVLRAIGDVQQFRKETTGALSSYQQALALFREIGAKLGEANVLRAIGDVQQFHDDWDSALGSYQQALALFREIGARLGEANVLRAIGDVQQFRDDRDGALSTYQQALTLFREIGDRLGEANVLQTIGDVQQFRKETSGALSSYQQALALFREIGDRLGEANVLKAIGDVQQFRKETSGALSSYQQALALFREIGAKLGEANVLQAIGDVQQFRDDRDGALSSYQQALALFRDIGDRLGEANVLAALSRLTIDSDPPQSQALLQQALTLRETINDTYSMGADLGNYGIALLQRGHNAEALNYLERARALFAERGIQEVLPQIDGLIAQARGGGAATPTLPDDLPEPVRQALEARDSAVFQAALEGLPEPERGAVIARLQEAGIIGRGPDMAEVLRQFEPLLRGIAAVATRDEGPRSEVEAALPRLEEGGWQLTDAVQRIWAGERDEGNLTAGIDANSATLVRRVLELVASSPTDEAPGDDTADTVEQLPASIQAAIASGDQRALQEALEALPPEERARVEALLREAREQAIAQARQRRPKEIVAGIPAAVRSALEQGDQAALSAALSGLADDERQRALADMADLQNLSMLAAQQQQRDPRERFAPLLRDIARVAQGEDGPRAAVEQALRQMEQAGWMLRGPVARIWQGERDLTVLTTGLDALDTSLIGGVLELVSAPELLERITDPPTSPRPDIDEIIQSFLPLLGDIALAAHGNEAARQIMEAVLPQLEERGWRLSDAARLLWEGERDLAQLTTNIDPNSAAIVRHALELTSGDLALISVAGSRELAETRRRAEQSTEAALASGDPAQRAEIARQLEQAAAQAELQPGAPWQSLAAELRALAAGLEET